MKNLAEVNICHHDIKDENILINAKSLDIRIIDFGSSESWDSPMNNKFRGTDVYSPPEIQQFKSYTADGTTAWSLGCLLYLMLYGSIPFEMDKDREIAKFKFHPETQISAAARNLISRCFQLETKDRITLNQICNHRYLLHEINQFRDIEVTDQPLDFLATW